MKKIEGYTKGPWQASKVKWAIDADDYVIARVCETRGDRAFLIHAPIGTEDEQDHDDDHGDANIALIASAPETYERCVALESMLKEMIDLVEHRWGYPNDASGRQYIVGRAEKLLEEKQP